MAEERILFLDEATVRRLDDTVPRFPPLFLGRVRTEASRTEVVRTALNFAHLRGLVPGQSFGGPNRIHVRVPDAVAGRANAEIVSLLGQALEHHWAGVEDGGARGSQKADYIGLSLPVELIESLRVAAFADHRPIEEFAVSMVEEAMARAMVRMPVSAARATWWIHASEREWTRLTGRAAEHGSDAAWWVENELRDMLARRR